MIMILVNKNNGRVGAVPGSFPGAVNGFGARICSFPGTARPVSVAGWLFAMPRPDLRCCHCCLIARATSRPPGCLMCIQ